MKEMDENTATIVELIQTTNLIDRPDLLALAKVAFIDYVASTLAASKEPKVVATAQQLATRKRVAHNRKLIGQPYEAAPEYAAFFNGFCSHYLDYDDAQANIAGHFSTVLFSVLLSVAKPTDMVLDILTAYVVGAELEGLLGAYLNPQHKLVGWHSTGTIGPLGGAAALAKLAKLTASETAQLLSLAGTQSAGMAFQAGSDTKPLHAGLAARNAVFAFWLLQETKLTANQNVFNNETGWLKTLGAVDIEPTQLQSQWLQPGQIKEPGLWMKLHPYCSAAICGASACEKIRKQYLVPRGYSWADIERVTFHFPPKADTALRYSAPQSGQEGRFSMEFVGWQMLALGHIEDDLFKQASVPEGFVESLQAGRFCRKHDLPEVAKDVRITKVTVQVKDGQEFSYMETAPLGSPANPFTADILSIKLANATSTKMSETLLAVMKDWPQGTMAEILKLL
ncbi:MmgE/PrpD family protein [Veillonella criceti]|uniref:MmgE/PrpD family n=1 Tax=Veillonella criceti TaxID=103891 RepID=A0A380NMI0_9FIRM|nr:MmgE/PrpD family protein [Veillonella criceti]SUP44786.1 MmgE/PrpD family [Veillonella criceti]